MYKILVPFITFSFMFVAHLSSQENVPAELTLKHKFFEVDIALDQLLGFKWRDGQLALRRDWIAQNKVEPEQEPEHDPRDRVGIERRLRDHIRGMGEQSPFQYELSQVTEKLGARGHGRSGGGDNMTIRYRCRQHKCSAQIDGENCYVTFRQSSPPHQRFTLEETVDGRLKLLLDYEEGFVLIAQGKAGHASVSVISNGNAATYTAKNFAEMYKHQPDVIDNIFAVVLDHLKIGQPLTTSSSEVKAYVTEQLLALRNSAQRKEELGKIISQLNSRKYAIRASATEALKASYPRWKTELTQLSADESLPVESRMRIKSIIADFKDDGKRYDSIIEIVKENELLSDDEYLFSLADENAQPLMDAIFAQVNKNSPELSLAEVKAKYKSWKTK